MITSQRLVATRLDHTATVPVVVPAEALVRPGLETSSEDEDTAFVLLEAALVVLADAFMPVDVVDASDRIPAEHLAAVEAVHLLKERHGLVRAIR
jgi:hypothetical protein